MGKWGYSPTYMVASPFITGQAHLVGKASQRGEEVLQDGAFFARRMQDSEKKGEVLENNFVSFHLFVGGFGERNPRNPSLPNVSNHEEVYGWTPKKNPYRLNHRFPQPEV